MISVTRSDALNGTMVVVGCAAAAVVLTNATLVTAGLSAKVGAAAAHRLGYQNAADVLQNNGERLLKMATKDLKRDLIFAGAFAALGLAAYVGQNYLTMQNVVLPTSPINLVCKANHTTNTTGVNINPTNTNGFDVHPLYSSLESRLERMQTLQQRVYAIKKDLMNELIQNQIGI